ncbi:MAG: zinc ABC transporter substrate-binding protein, partial [Actinomycetota bacterium]|nr:zinc ABC transporter substrate-binding protein [Actinomycetota bacterium]
ADCARPDLVTADHAFAAMAGRYGLVDHAVSDPDIARVLAARQVATIFTEPLVPAGPAVALARQAHVGTGLLETLETRTPAEAGRGATYVSLMADNLDKLRQAQACPAGNPS